MTGLRIVIIFSITATYLYTLFHISKLNSMGDQKYGKKYNILYNTMLGMLGMLGMLERLGRGELRELGNKHSKTAQMLHTDYFRVLNIFHYCVKPYICICMSLDVLSSRSQVELGGWEAWEAWEGW